MLKVNEKIPTEVKLFNEKGEETTLGNYIGQSLIIYFYPKDNTTGCTFEASQFKESKHIFLEKGIKILGVSKDSVKSHQAFKEKLSLNFELLSDPDHELQDGFGVWQEKRMMGKSYMGTVRSTFLVDPKGIIRKVWSRVSPKNHVQEVLDYIKQESNGEKLLLYIKGNFFLKPVCRFFIKSWFWLLI